jgi:hypothetical protein
LRKDNLDTRSELVCQSKEFIGIICRVCQTHCGDALGSGKHSGVIASRDHDTTMLYLLDESTGVSACSHSSTMSPYPEISCRIVTASDSPGFREIQMGTIGAR